MSAINILLVDDHELIRDGIKALLEDETDIKVIAEASNGLEALSILPKIKVDIVIMDIRMPGLNGIEASQKILARNNPPHILFLTMHDTEDHVIRAVRSGAHGYLLKDTGKEEFIKAIFTVNRGEKYFSTSISSILVDKILNPNESEEDEMSQNIKLLTPREKQIFKLISEGYSNKEIAERLSKSVRTIETHRFNLMKKMQVKNVVELLKKGQESELI